MPRGKPSRKESTALDLARFQPKRVPISREERVSIARIKELSADTLENALERARILKSLNLHWTEYATKNVGISHVTGYRLIMILDHPRMKRTDVEWPCAWTVVYEILILPEELFLIIIGQKPWRGRMLDWNVNYHTTREQIREFKKMYYGPDKSDLTPVPLPDTLLNSILHGDCRNLFKLIPERSINLACFSPPYVMKRDFGVPESRYPKWFAHEVMEGIRPLLTNDGSVLVVIRSHIRHGVQSNYILDTLRELMTCGWHRIQTLIWFKPDAPPLGSLRRLVQSFDYVFWFSRTVKPYVNLKAAGKPTKRGGASPGSQRFNGRLMHGYNPVFIEGTARVRDVIVIPVGDMDKGIEHDAMYPQTLAEWLIKTFCRPGDRLLDPFMGSGTTALAARRLGRDFIGMEIKAEYVRLAIARLKTEA